MAEQWDELYTLSSDPTWLEEMWKVNKYDVQKYWTQIESDSNLRIVDAYNQSHDSELSNSVYLIIATLFSCMGQAKEAMELFKHTEQICRDLGNQGGLAASLDKQAIILMALGRPEEAIQLLKQEEQICREVGDMKIAHRLLFFRTFIRITWSFRKLLRKKIESIKR